MLTLECTPPTKKPKSLPAPFAVFRPTDESMLASLAPKPEPAPAKCVKLMFKLGTYQEPQLEYMGTRIRATVDAELFVADNLPQLMRLLEPQIKEAAEELYALDREAESEAWHRQYERDRMRD